MVEENQETPLEVASDPQITDSELPEAPENEKNEKSLRTITVQNLRHPGGYLSSRQFQSLLNKSVEFQAKFSRPEDSDERQIKTGSIEIVFATFETARDAYTSLQKMAIDGYRPEALVDSRFLSTELSTPSKRQFFEISNDSRLVFLLDAPKSIDLDMISYFFKDERPIHFQILPMPTGNGLYQVEVLMSSREVAEEILAREEATFSISDEDGDYVVTLLSPREYGLYSKMDDIRASTTSRSSAPAVIPRVTPSSESIGQLAPEIDEDVVLKRLLEIIAEENLNFGEIEEIHAKDELYRLCDRVSEEYDGIPDSILKPAMGTALQRHLNQTELHWMRNQIEGLLRMWKLEILNEEIYKRETMVEMKAANYQPVFEAEKKETNSKGAQKRQKAARAQMGVGAFLTAHRDRLIVESGDVEMDSDDDGNVMIGGEALSFDSWARITKTKASGVVRANEDGSKKIGNGGLTKKQMRQARLVEGMNQDEYKQWRKEKSSARKADIKQRIMARGAVIEGEEGEEGHVDSEAVAAPAPATSSAPAAPPVKKDLDEGEIDSDEERKEAALTKKPPATKRHATSDSSESSTSSSSEEDPDGPIDARKRRKMRRKKDRKLPRAAMTTSTTPQVNLEFRQMFENRKAIIAQMSPAHKAAFASALNQIAQNNGGAQAKASQVITSMMSGFK
ncbi:hypothetical protein L3Y34_003399 [Caenorhabditis briggsae]|uniref:Protein CBR-SNA-2 n=1 Tax=Caenorhabditis briggsae TaxID=6238 RepID=A0AAE9A8U8_CAEBR|nr:hypothetical protein L3Y34_003399 [Caenorhabditis briggsae]